MWDREQTILEYSQNFEKPYSYEDINDMAVNRDRQRKRSGNYQSIYCCYINAMKNDT